MTVELFGIEIAQYAALSAVISFLITGHRSVFSSQKIGMKKAQILEVNLGEDVHNAKTHLSEKGENKIYTMKKTIQKKKLWKP